MKILNREEFLALPSGVLYSKFRYSIMEGLEIKYDSLHSDWACQELIDTPRTYTGDYMDVDAIYEESEKQGKSFVLDYDAVGRDGLYEENQLFAVYEKGDVQVLMNTLGDLLPNYPEIDTKKPMIKPVCFFHLPQ